MTKSLVAYFSATGTTAGAAELLAKAADAELFAIRPAVPYTKADLNWMDDRSRSSLEMRDPSSRPAIAGRVENMDAYDRVYLGFPIWWYVAPTIINSFLESYDFSGKTIVLFATSGGSGFGKTVEGLEGSVSPTARIMGGRLLNGRLSESELRAWVKSL
ncbi:MAG: flavodoxin [Clostridiales bacterium]|nr:flavodoxin [Clostridiales bacterium]